MRRARHRAEVWASGVIGVVVEADIWTRCASAVLCTWAVVPATGLDTNPGTAAAPFQTVARAQAAVRSVKAKQGGTLTTPVTVILAAGESTGAHGRWRAACDR